jgi:cytidine deaminase
MSDDDVAYMPVGQCRELLVELQAVRLRHRA